MGAREGGSYVASSKGGEPKLQERTALSDLHTVDEKVSAAELPTAPAPPAEPEAPAPAKPDAPASAKPKPQE